MKIEDILVKARREENLSKEEIGGLSLYADLLQFTLESCKKEQIVYTTRKITNEFIQYRKNGLSYETKII